MNHLRDNLAYLHKLGKVRVRATTTRVITKLGDGARDRANSEDMDGNTYLPMSIGYLNCYYSCMESLGFKFSVSPNGSLTAEQE